MALMRIYLNVPNVRILLIKRNLTQKELAQKMNITHTYISLILSNKITVSPQIRRKFLQYFPGQKWEDIFVLKEKNNELQQ